MNKNRTRTAWRQAWAFAGALLAASWSLSAQSQTVVEAVTTSVQGGVEVVRIDFSQPLQAVPHRLGEA